MTVEKFWLLALLPLPHRYVMEGVYDAILQYHQECFIPVCVHPHLAASALIVVNIIIFELGLSRVGRKLAH